MSEPIWLLDSVVNSIHKMLLAEHGGLSGIRDKGLLSSALAKPKQLYSYHSDASIYDLAAAYSLGIAKNHPFIDGNKRTAFTIAVVFLELNGISFDAPEAEAVIYFEGLASGSISDKELASWFSESSHKISLDSM